LNALSISEAFARREQAGQVALVPYVTAGYPSADATVPVLHALAEAGADVIELGIPFSDPLADGPTIQKSSFEALEAGTTVPRVLADLRAFREDHETPVVLFTYLNPVMCYGVADFLADAEEAGAQGLLLTDLPTGADPELESAVVDSGRASFTTSPAPASPERGPR
jgi:tryptophan synthase alpha chain